MPCSSLPVKDRPRRTRGQQGRRLTGHERAQEVLSPLAQRQHGFVMQSLPQWSTILGNLWDEALRDNIQLSATNSTAACPPWT
jgi:hypothetical protein